MRPLPRTLALGGRCYAEFTKEWRKNKVEVFASGVKMGLEFGLLFFFVGMWKKEE